MSDQPKAQPKLSDIRGIEQAVLEDAWKICEERNAIRGDFGIMTARAGFKGTEFTLKLPKTWPNKVVSALRKRPEDI